MTLRLLDQPYRPFFEGEKANIKEALSMEVGHNVLAANNGRQVNHIVSPQHVRTSEKGHMELEHGACLAC